MKIALILCLALVACQTKPISKEPDIRYAFDGQTLSVWVKLPKGLHAYASGEKIGLPVDLVIKPANNWLLAEPVILPKGDQKHLLNHNFELKVRLKAGSGPVSGILKMQLCSDNSCERPKNYAFQVSL